MQTIIKTLPPDQFMYEETVKTQFCLHHTVSWGNDYSGDYTTWAKSKERVATPFIIEQSGRRVQVFPPHLWAHHLYVHAKGNKIDSGFKTLKVNIELNKHCFGIEIDSAGPLVYKDGKFYRSFAVGKKKGIVEPDMVVEYPEKFRGYQFYERYTDEQIESVRLTMLEMVEKGFVIKDALNYGSDIWDVSLRALSGHPGIFSHVSYRSDKSDAHPQKQLIEMLEGININS